MKIVYIAHPIASDGSYTTDENVADLLRIIRYLNMGGTDEAPFDEEVVPMAPYIGDVLAMDDTNVFQRKRGIENDVAMIETGIFEELWLTGHKISLGMQEEIKLFVAQGKKVVNLIGKI
jgi:hypothetical protein